MIGTDWALVFTSKGTHFFYNALTNESHWRVQDAKVTNALEKIERDIFLLLIAKSRGLKLDVDVEEKLSHGLVPKTDHDVSQDALQQNKLIEDEEIHENFEEKEDETEVRQKTTPLISGYSSSEDESDGDDEAETSHQDLSDPVPQEPIANMEQAEEPQAALRLEVEESSDEENALDMADLQDLSSDEEQSTTHNAELTFLQLLHDSNLNPFGLWETESLKIINDPRFHEVDNNRDRKRIFDEWTTAAIEQRKVKEVEGAEEEEDQEEDPLVEYIKFLETRQDLERLYIDFKKKWKKQLKKLKLGDREKEKVYKEYVIYCKKPEPEKFKIFKEFLMSAKIFKKNVQEAQDVSILGTLQEDKVEVLEYEAAYKLLHQLEKNLNVSESLRFNTKYYILGPNKRIGLILEIARLYSH